MVSALVLFLMGAALAYYTLPKALDFLVNIGGENLNTQFRPAPYFQLISYMMLAFGVGFEFPVVLVFLQLAGPRHGAEPPQRPALRHRRHRRAGGGAHAVG